MSNSEVSGQKKLNRRALLKRGMLGACALGGLGAAYGSYSSWKRKISREDLPTIVLITLDTTRADHLGCYGYSRPTSPHIDNLAAESLVYEKAIASATWTLPSHASLFTGKFTASHGVCKAADGALDLTIEQYGPQAWNHYRAHPIAADEQTLAMLLRDSGYATAAVVAGPWMKSVFGMSKGFDDYDDENINTINARRAEEVTDRALQLMTSSSQQPQFLFLNYFDPHMPYSPPEEFARKFVLGDTEPLSPSHGPITIRKNVGLYDAEILYMDYHIGRLLAGLRQLDLYDDSLIIVTADHGELLGEHGNFGHPGLVYQEAVHVPMIVKAPGAQSAAGRVDDWIQLIDLFPMILNAAQIEMPDGIQGDAPPAINHPIIIESRTLPGVNTGGDWFAIIEENWKFVWSSKGNHMFFNLEDDPQEQQNLFMRFPQQARRLGDLLHEYLADLPEPAPRSPARMDRQTQAKLRSLGYLQ